MGGNHSLLPPKPLGFDYMCIAIRAFDKLRVVLGSDYEVAIIRQIIQETWPKGIQKETFELNGVHEFKLKGNPFCPNSSSSEAIACRRMAERILHRLYRDGWKLQLSSNLTRTTDLTSWIFKKVPVVDVSSQPFLVVGLSAFDSLMILNAPMDLHQLFKDAIERSWPNGIQKWKYENEVLIVKLKGYPWCPDGEATVHSRVIIQTIISDLMPRQWNLYGNSNIKSDCNTLFFEHNPMMVPGQPSPAQFIISLNSTDLLRVIGAPENIVSAVRSTIQSIWLKGIQKESSYAGSWEFKMKGNPWWASGDEAVESRFLVMKLMEALQVYGWSPVSAIDSSRKDSDKSSLLFRQSQPKQAPFFCLSLNETDKLRLINASEDVTKICQYVIQTQYVLGIQRLQRYGTSLEFKLTGNPWECIIDGHDGLHARNMICHLFSALASRGWKAVISADVSAKYIHQDKGPDYPLDVDSIFFLYDPAVAGAQPSAPPMQMPYAQPYPQPFAQPYPQLYPQPPSYGFAQQDAPPPFNPPPYGVYPNPNQ